MLARTVVAMAGFTTLGIRRGCHRLPGGLVALAAVLAACAPPPSGVPTPPATPSGARRIVTEADLIAPGAGLREGQSAVVFSEHGSSAADANDSGGAGFDEVPLIVSAEGDLTLVFGPGETGHTLELRGQDHQVIARLDAKTPRLRAAVPPGRHALVLRHAGGGDPSARVPFFVHHGRSQAAPGRFALLADPGGTTVEVTREGCADCDLAGHAFKAVTMDGMNFSGANLAGAVFDGASLEGATLAGATLTHAVVGDSSLKVADLRGASFVGARIARTRFDGADLRAATFHGATIDACAFPGVNARGASFQAAKFQMSEGVDFSDADLTDANLRGLVFVGGSFARATLTRASFAGATLSEVDCAGVNAGEADFSGAYMLMVGLSQAYFAGASFRRATLNSSFSGTVLDRASFHFATAIAGPPPPGLAATSTPGVIGEFMDVSAVEADFTGARLQGVRFNNSDLSRARLFQADVTDAIFLRTILTGANLLVSGTPYFAPAANLDGAILPTPR